MFRSLSIWMTSLFDFHLDNLLSLFISTTEELQFPLHRFFHCLLWFPVHLMFVIIFSPIGFFGWLLWMLVSNNTNTFKFSMTKSDYLQNNIRGKTAIPNFNIATINSGLHTDFLSRQNNLSNSLLRAKKIGDILSGIHRFSDNDSKNLPENYISVHQKTFKSKSSMDFVTIPKEYYEELNAPYLGNSSAQLSSARTQSRDIHDVINHDILCEFPELDFLLMQGVFDVPAAKEIVKSLHKRFPYIIYDPRQDGFASNFWSLGSGLLIASLYPITHVNFDVFKLKEGGARVASLGLLQAKISIGKNRAGQHIVGYFTNTQLQSSHGESAIHWSQLLQVRAACSTMKTLTSSHEDVVLFDIIGGDFSLDNISPVDQVERTHPLFEEYIDVCREGPGCDKQWTVGSEMRHIPLHDSLIQTPEGLRHALVTPELRTRYIVDATIMRGSTGIKKLMPPVDTFGEVYVTDKSGKRRVDYLLYNRDYPVTVSSYNAVTELAGMTDHICFSMTFSPSKICRQ